MPRKRPKKPLEELLDFPSSEAQCVFIGMDEYGQHFDTKFFIGEEAAAIDLFFEDLAAHPFGWTQSKTWQSKNKDFFLEATHTGGALVLLNYRFIRCNPSDNTKELRGTLTLRVQHLNDFKRGCNGLLHRYLANREISKKIKENKKNNGKKKV